MAVKWAYSFLFQVCYIFLSCCILVGGKYLNFNISRVYEFRELAAESLPGIFGYLMPIFSKAIIPFGLVISILCKHRLAIIIFIFCSIMVFSITSHKAPLFYPFIIIGLVYFLKFKNADYLNPPITYRNSSHWRCRFLLDARRFL